MFTVCNGWQYAVTITINHLFTFCNLYITEIIFVLVFIVIVNARDSARALASQIL